MGSICNLLPDVLIQNILAIAAPFARVGPLRCVCKKFKALIDTEVFKKSRSNMFPYNTLNVVEMEAIPDFGDLNNRSDVIKVSKAAQNNKMTIRSKYTNDDYTCVSCRPPLECSQGGCFLKITVDSIAPNNSWFFLGVLGTKMDVATHMYWTDGETENVIGWYDHGTTQRAGRYDHMDPTKTIPQMSVGECFYFGFKSGTLSIYSATKDYKARIHVDGFKDWNESGGRIYLHLRFEYRAGTKLTLEPLIGGPNEEIRHLLLDETSSSAAPASSNEEHSSSEEDDSEEE